MLITCLKSVSQIEEKQQMAHVVMSIEIPKCGLAYCFQRPSIYNSKSIINGGSAQNISETFPIVKNGMLLNRDENIIFDEVKFLWLPWVDSKGVNKTLEI